MKRKIFFLLTLIILFSVVYNRWIFNLGILTSSDWPYFFNQTLTSLRIHYFSLWLGDISLGRVVFDLSQAPTYSLYGLLAKVFNMSYALNERIVHFWPEILIMPISAYLLLNKLFKSKMAIFIGILVFSFNTYFVILQTSFPTLMVAYSLAPLIIFSYIKSLERRSLTYALLTALLLFIDSSYETRGAYVIAFILIFYLIFYIFNQEKKKYLAKIKVLLTGFLPFIAFFMLSFYWLLGIGKVGLLTSNSIFDRGLFGNGFLNILYATTLFHPFWTGGKTTEFIIQPIPLYFWIIPLLAFLGLYLNRKNKHIIFFGFIALLGIFLTKQVAQPFSDIYPWLYQHFPGFNAFREASKFYFLIALGYSVLIAGFVDWLWKNWTNTKLQIFGKYILVCIIAFIFLWNTKPLITGEIKTLFVNYEVPSDYLILKEYLLNKPEYFRVLWTPTYSRWSFYTYNHPKISNIDILNSEWDIFIKNKRGIKVTEAELSRDMFILSYSNNLLNNTSIKYVIVPIEDKASNDDFFHYFGKPRQYYINELNKISYLHKVNIGTKELVIYENENYKPHLYETNTKETINEKVEYQKISYGSVSPTEYRVQLNNVKQPIYLNFSEGYHPDWKLRLGEFNWVDVLTKRNYFIDDKNHLKNDAGLNSFYINPIIVCNVHKVNNVYKVGNGCVRNADGSYDISGTLYFAPQSYMYLGLIISGATLVAIVGYLFFVLRRNVYERKNK